MKFMYSLIQTMQLLLIIFYLYCNQFNNSEIVSQVEYKEGWNQERVLAIPKPNRLDPSIYLNSQYIKNQLAKFNDGASKIVTKATLDYFGYEKIGDPSGQFVITKLEMDAILYIADGNVTLIELALGIPLGGWEKQELFRIDINNPQQFNLRIPSGNERGANDFWIPGGVLQNGIAEAVIEQIEKGQYELYKIQLQA